MNGPILASLIPVLNYPEGDFEFQAHSCLQLLELFSPGQADLLRPFAESLAGQTMGELEEAYIRTFDHNPATSLELGWHLHGESYERGAFLVRLRQLLDQHGVIEGTDLPDHISHILGLLPLMDADEAAELAHTCLPAIHKIKAQLEKGESPYRHVFNCLTQLLETTPEPQRN